MNPEERETSEAYRGVVAKLNERFRVIDSLEKPPHRQWILQRRRSRNNPDTWKGDAYTQKRATLLRVIRERVRDRIDPAALALVEALPEVIDGSHVIPKEEP